MNNEPMTLEKLGSAVEKIGSGLEQLGFKVEKVSSGLEKLESKVEMMGAGLEKLTERFDTFEKNVDERFTKVDGDIRGLGVIMEAMDDKFTLISEGQDVIREVLETRVAHIEEILEVNVK